MKYFHISILVFMVFLIGCTRNTASEKGLTEITKAQDSTSQIPGIYLGLLPCADCSGIEYTLTMNPDSTFILKSVYLGKPADRNTFIEAGQWSFSPGGPLLLELPQQNVFLKPIGKNLLWLDEQGQEIKSAQNHQLSRIGNFE